MSEYEKPTVTYVGNLNDRAGELPSATYQVGDFVWANNVADHSGTRWLAHIESGHSVRSPGGRRWVVRVRRRSFWTSGAMHMFIQGKLTPEEIEQHRKTGLIPPAGQPL